MMRVSVLETEVDCPRAVVDQLIRGLAHLEAVVQGPRLLECY